jgi:hypothetical protein
MNIKTPAIGMFWTLLVLASPSHARSSITQSQRVGVCTPTFIELTPCLIYDNPKAPSAGTRVMLIGCKERLREISESDQQEIRLKIADFLAKTGWTFWWRVKEVPVRRDLLKDTHGFRIGAVTDLLFFDPIASEP